MKELPIGLPVSHESSQGLTNVDQAELALMQGRFGINPELSQPLDDSFVAVLGRDEEHTLAAFQAFPCIPAYILNERAFVGLIELEQVFLRLGKF
jgi:hypothetical protein